MYRVDTEAWLTISMLIELRHITIETWNTGLKLSVVVERELGGGRGGAREGGREEKR